jgi:hypothetical protein
MRELLTKPYSERVGLIPLIGGLVIPPLAWALDLQISYAAVKSLCEHDRGSLLLLIPVASLATVALGGWCSWTSLIKVRGSADEEGGSIEDRSYFLSLAGLGMTAVSALLILLAVVPRYYLSPCE